MLGGTNEMTFTDNVEPYSFMFIQTNPHSQAVSCTSEYANDESTQYRPP